MRIEFDLDLPDEIIKELENEDLNRKAKESFVMTLLREQELKNEPLIRRFQNPFEYLGLLIVGVLVVVVGSWGLFSSVFRGFNALRTIPAMLLIYGVTSVWDSRWVIPTLYRRFSASWQFRRFRLRSR
jgi:hypothetical protein